jgi:predicted DNA-binding protein
MESESALDAQREERLARFGDRAGKHGPAAARRIATMIRIPVLTDTRADSLARSLGTRKATLLVEAITVLANCDPSRWYAAVSAFQRAAGKAPRVITPDPFGGDDEEQVRESG